VGHYGFYGGIALSLLAYSFKEGSIEHEDGVLKSTRFDEAIAEIAEGNAFGCMVLTESDAGSDLSAIRAKAVPTDDGKWKLSGQKIFITSGHGQHQLVLAKTENTGNGLKDLSLFIVPRKIDRDGKLVDNVEIERLEEKLGICASVTATLSYDDSEAELIGERGQGFELMLMLMNNARLGVGFEGIGLLEGAWRMAKEYAAERKSMGQTIDRHEMIADYLDRMEVQIKGMRAMAFAAAHAVDLQNRLEVKLQLDPPADAEQRRALEKRIKAIKWRARELTPLIKYQAAERAVELSSLALQIFGGVGYTKDYLIEKFVRDAYVLPIYEGTSQIQALMALKDQLQKAIKDPAGFVRTSAQARIAALSARDPLDRKLAKLETKLYGAMQHILTRIARDKWQWVSEKKITEWASAFLKDWDAKRDFSFGLLHAERLTRILSEVTISRILVEQAHRFPERKELAERYLERAAPVVSHQLDEILHTGDRLLRQLANGQPEASEAESA
jgi:alkylation response protein AidB-like acyl-CoA dehydrogenase